ncbi:coagulation factor X-like, partial [Clarias magur]
MLWVFRTCLCLLFAHCATSEVFLHTKDANQVLARHRRANSVFEELKKGDMERECREERCSYEEAREIFEDVQKTNEFWNVYVDGDACLSNPCLNKGLCKDAVGKYTCSCPELFRGYNCEIAIPQLCEDKNGGCDHFCKVDQKKGTALCSCAKGYNLAADKKTCTSDDPFKCGHVFPKGTRSITIHRPTENATNTGNGTSPINVSLDTLDVNTVKTNSSAKKNTNDTESQGDSWFGLIDPSIIVEEEPVLPVSCGVTRIVNGEECPPGECPWQALLMNEDKMGFCGGTILNEYFILSAAHCMNLSRSIIVIL